MQASDWLSQQTCDRLATNVEDVSDDILATKLMLLGVRIGFCSICLSLTA